MRTGTLILIFVAIVVLASAVWLLVTDPETEGFPPRWDGTDQPTGDYLAEVSADPLSSPHVPVYRLILDEADEDLLRVLTLSGGYQPTLIVELYQHRNIGITEDLLREIELDAETYAEVSEAIYASGFMDQRPERQALFGEQSWVTFEVLIDNVYAAHGDTAEHAVLAPLKAIFLGICGVACEEVPEPPEAPEDAEEEDVEDEEEDGIELPERAAEPPPEPQPQPQP